MTAPISLFSAPPAIIGMGTLGRTMAASFGQPLDPDDCGFGSQCLPKDLAALAHAARTAGRRAI